MCWNFGQFTKTIHIFQGIVYPSVSIRTTILPSWSRLYRSGGEIQNKTSHGKITISLLTVLFKIMFLTHNTCSQRTDEFEAGDCLPSVQEINILKKKNTHLKSNHTQLSSVGSLNALGAKEINTVRVYFQNNRYKFLFYRFLSAQQKFTKQLWKNKGPGLVGFGSQIHII